MNYSKEFKKDFKKLVNSLTTEQIASILKISEQEVRRIKRELNI